MYITLLEQIITILAPHNCLICKKEGNLLCDGCKSKVIETKASTCFLCNKTTNSFKSCNTCLRKSRVKGVIVVSHYKNNAKELVQLLKYKHAREAAVHIASLLSGYLNTKDFDCITFVPASAARYRQRGFNQAALIANNLSSSSLECHELLGRFGYKSQVGTSRTHRLRQVKNSFYPKNKRSIQGKRILIIDDVVTTGATINECGRILKEAGAKSVWGAAFAKN